MNGKKILNKKLVRRVNESKTLSLPLLTLIEKDCPPPIILVAVKVAKSNLFAKTLFCAKVKKIKDKVRIAGENHFLLRSTNQK